MSDDDLRDLLVRAEDALHSFSMRALGVSPRLQVPYTDAPELSPWTHTIGPQARRAHDLAREIRKRLGLSHRMATRALGTPPLAIEDMTPLYEEWADSDAHLYEGDEYGHERAAFFAGFAAALRPDGEPGAGEPRGGRGEQGEAGQAREHGGT